MLTNGKVNYVCLIISAQFVITVRGEKCCLKEIKLLLGVGYLNQIESVNSNKTATEFESNSKASVSSLQNFSNTSNSEFNGRLVPKGPE